MSDEMFPLDPVGREWSHTGYAQRILFGAGVLDQLPAAVKAVGARRVLLVTTEGRLSSDDGQRVVKLLGRALGSTFSQTTSHVPTTAVQAAVRQAQADSVDGIVSFGGGSCADLAKAVCFFTERQAGTPGTSYVDRPVLPHVAVPTAYSGAELTPYFGMTERAAGRKTGAGGPTMAPLAAIYDPLITLSTPAVVSAQTGMNCLAHGVEAAFSPARSAEAEALALACVRGAAIALPLVVDDPDDLGARTAMLEAAVLGGRCLHNASVGIHHGLAQLIGGRTNMPHGLANAILLAHTTRFTAPAVPYQAARVGTALGDPDDAAGAIDRLRERLGLPGSLSSAGMDDDDLDAVVRMAVGSPVVAANPRPAGEDDIRGVLEAAW